MEISNKIPIKQNNDVPLISIIVPVYNLEAYIQNCLQSILNQKYSPIEIIVVDDGSKDQTPKILDSFARMYPEIIRVIHIPNGGVTNARMTGIKAAKGAWIGFVDGDDEIEPDMYKRLLQNAMNNDADISHCGYQTIVNGGERIHYFYNTGKKVVQDHMTGLKDLVDGVFVEPGLGNKLFKKDLFDMVLSTDIMDRSIRINEDLMLNYILFDQAQKSVYEDFCPYHYMSRNGSVSRDKFNIHKIMDPIKVKKWIALRAYDEFADIAWKRYLSTCVDSYSTLCRNRKYYVEAKKIKDILLSNKDKWKLFGKKQYFRIWMVVYFPSIYHLMYSFYTIFFQKKIYE